MADQWSAFPDATPATPSSRPKRTLFGAKAVAPGTVLTAPAPHDGDTVKANEGTIRLAGVDAPELAQLGYDRSGNAIRIGEQSLDALKSLSGRGPLTTGPVFGSSYGRTVSPLGVNGSDAGEYLLRTGNAFAAPQYLGSDPQRQSLYVQAERLARLNRLGMNQTYVPQTPEQFRHDGPVIPDRETVARWWDTPTPLQGLPADKEATLRQLYASGTAEQINGFLAANHYATSRPQDLAAFIKKRDAAMAKDKHAGINTAVSYEEAPPLMIDSGDGAGGAAVRKFASGFTMGGLDELGAVADTLGLTGGRESIFNSNRRFADIWDNNQRQNAGILAYDQTAHPYVSTGAEIAGGLTSGFLIPYGQGARTIPELAKVGAVYGAGTGFLGTDGGIGDRSIGAIKGSLAGALATPALGKAFEAVAPALAAAYRRSRGWEPPVGASGAVDAPIPNDAPSAAPEAPAGNAGHDWSAFPPADHLPAMAMDGAPGESLSAPAPGEPRQRDYLDLGPQRPRPLLNDYNTPERVAAAERVDPRSVLPIPANAVGSVEEAAAIDAGRFGPAKAPNERDYLDRLTVPGLNGPVPKVGPMDMVGWLRTAGGLKPDPGGELLNMGLTNAARRGLDHVGQETRFGPLIHDQGMNLDDAALAAWEAGYFPEHSDRPSINDFLDGLHGTFNGYNRRFRSEDMGQLEAFNAARTQRHDLQRMEADGPVSFDRSEPAGPDAPFAPPEAYDDASRETIRRVGNIDVSKLDSPQDIARALKVGHDSIGGFDAATRGTVSNAETERLATDLGMTADQLLARRKGEAFNAHEALAARQILAKSGNELVNAAKAIAGKPNPGDELLAEFHRKMLRHVAIQEQVAGMTAEAGRALQQFRQLADSRAVRSDVLSSIIEKARGPKRLQDAADALLDAVEQGPGKFAVVADKLSRPKWIDKATELRYFMLLSGPQTHAANIISNTLTAIGQIPEHAVAVALGGGRRLVQGQEKALDRVYGSEIGQRAFGLMAGLKDGMRQFARTLRTGETSDHFGKIEGPETVAIGGKLGSVVRAPMHALAAEDEVFKAMARNMELRGLAARTAAQEGLKGEAAASRIAELVNNPSDEMLLQAFDYARYLTFQRPLKGLPQTVSMATMKHPALKFLVPFVRTPTNLLKFAAERSPAAPLLKDWRADWLAGGARRDLAVAKMMVGSSVGLYAAKLAADGIITGSPPDDKNKENLLRANGWQPYSVKIGDTYVSYARLDPFALTLSTAADLATKSDGMTDKQLENSVGLTVASIVHAMGDKTWTSGLSDFFQMLDDPQRNLGNYGKQQAASLVVPAALAQTARAIDPTRRVTHSVGEEVQSRIPFASESLPTKRDIFGNPVVTDRLGPDIVSPITTTQDRHDPVAVEMLRLGSTATAFPKQHTVVGKRVDYSPDEYDRLSAEAGQREHAAISQAIRSTNWAGMTDDAKRKAVMRIVEDARKEARAGAAPASADPWGAFPDAPGHKPANDPWASFPSATTRDVRAELSAAIPGVQFTSGFRDPAYNASLRARGYHPAVNSEHLDGSALDMLPPPGKSLAWLEQQVAKYDPKARLLVHDGHLHGGFNGYYSAPKLGGMRGR